MPIEVYNLSSQSSSLILSQAIRARKGEGGLDLIPDGDWNEESFEHMSIDRVYFDLGSWSGTTWKKIEFRDCEFFGGIFYNVEFIDCTFSNVLFYSISARGSRFTNSRFSDVVFSGAILNDSMFDRCSIFECKFNADMMGGVSDLTGVTFEQSPTDRIDFSSSIGYSDKYR